jgi:hypothetical protein
MYRDAMNDWAEVILQVCGGNVELNGGEVRWPAVAAAVQQYIWTGLQGPCSALGTHSSGLCSQSVMSGHRS